MASANVELVRSIFTAWERGDFSSAEWADPKIEFVFADGPSPGSWIGPAGLAKANRDFLSAWEDLRQQAGKYTELDSERVLVLHRFTARGKMSGLELGQMRGEGAALFHIRGGKVVRLVHYFNRELALADLDLAPDAGSSRS